MPERLNKEEKKIQAALNEEYQIKETLLESVQPQDIIKLYFPEEFLKEHKKSRYIEYLISRYEYGKVVYKDGKEVRENSCPSFKMWTGNFEKEGEEGVSKLIVDGTVTHNDQLMFLVRPWVKRKDGWRWSGQKYAINANNCLIKPYLNIEIENPSETNSESHILETEEEVGGGKRIRRLKTKRAKKLKKTIKKKRSVRTRRKTAYR